MASILISVWSMEMQLVFKAPKEEQNTEIVCFMFTDVELYIMYKHFISLLSRMLLSKRSFKILTISSKKESIQKHIWALSGINTDIFLRKNFHYRRFFINFTIILIDSTVIKKCWFKLTPKFV